MHHLITSSIFSSVLFLFISCIISIISVLILLIICNYFFLNFFDKNCNYILPGQECFSWTIVHFVGLNKDILEELKSKFCFLFLIVFPQVMHSSLLRIWNDFLSIAIIYKAVLSSFCKYLYSLVDSISSKALFCFCIYVFVDLEHLPLQLFGKFCDHSITT